MMDIIAIWITVASLGLTLAIPLGPVNAEMIKNALAKAGYTKLVLFSTIFVGIGAMLGDIIIALSALTIGGELLADVFSVPLVKLLLFSINIIILSYLGMSTLFKDPAKINNFYDDRKELNKDVTEVPVSFILKDFMKRYFTGFSLVMTSPWSYLWWISAGTIILFSDFNVPGFFPRLAIVIMFLSGIFLWVVIFSSVLALIGRLPNPRLFNWITKGSAFILLFFAGIIVLDALEILLEMLDLSKSP